jgi:hypothetical protein
VSVVERTPHVTGRNTRRLPPRSRKVVLLVHIIASVALVGEVWGLVLLNLSATLTDDAELAHAAYLLMAPLVFAGGIPLSFISLISGIVLGLGSRWGVLRHFWVVAKLVLLIATVLVGALLSTPEDLAAAMSGGATPGAARQWGQVAAVGGQLFMLLTATALSVFKPRVRSRSSGKPARHG